MANILAIDLGTHMGWAARTLNQLDDEYGVTSGHDLFQEGIRPGTRYLRFNTRLAELIETNRPDVVCYERLTFPHKSIAAAHVYYGMLAVLEMRCAISYKRLISFPTFFIKKVATDKGNATKEEMIEAACKHYGRTIEDDNEADALWLLETARKVNGGELAGPVRKSPQRSKEEAP